MSKVRPPTVFGLLGCVALIALYVGSEQRGRNQLLVSLAGAFIGVE
jgi:hypothetical protein